MFRHFRSTLLLPAVLLAVGCSDSDTTAPEENLTIVDVAIEAEFSTLVTAVQVAGLEEALRGDGPFTVFAPTNEAFANLPAGALEGLLADPEALAGVLTYHVIPGRILAGDLSDGIQVETLQGQSVTITLMGGARINGVNIIATDIEASNGVIHVIDGVLLPPEVG